MQRDYAVFCGLIAALLSALVNSLEASLGHLESAGIRPNNASPFGVFDLSGNLWQWYVHVISENPPDGTLSFHRVTLRFPGFRLGMKSCSK